MKKFIYPVAEVTVFSVKDILTVSGTDESTSASSYVPVDPELPGDDFE